MNETRAAERYDVDFSTTKVASGVYFYRMQAGSFVSIKKMIVLK